MRYTHPLLIYISSLREALLNRFGQMSGLYDNDVFEHLSWTKSTG